LESIAFSSTVISVGYSAFYDYRSLGEIVLNKGIKTIERDTFDGCSSIESFQFADLSAHLFTIRIAQSAEFITVWFMTYSKT